MPRRRQSFKAQRQSKKRHSRNIRAKSAIKKTIKELQALAAAKNIAEARKILKIAISKLAKAAKKGIIHQNTAIRKISRLSRKIAKLTA